jgi:hypothetical protein
VAKNIAKTYLILPVKKQDNFAEQPIFTAGKRQAKD